MKIIDMRSDTVTRPTPEMRRAMAEAPVGDDVYGDDPTVNQLEALGAQTLGKEAAVFVPSGVMGNQVSIMAWTSPGDEIILGANCHIVQHEAGAAGRLSGVNYAPVANPDDKIYPADVHRLVRPDDIHCPRTSLVCLENALGNGDVVSAAQMAETYRAAKEHGLPVHLDGARLFNAACALKVEARELAASADSVSLCLSKGLCSPVGALICGPKDFIAKARRCRKLIGGGMRQAGILAACGLISLTKMAARLKDDHDNAQYLGARLAEMAFLKVDADRIKINMVYWQPADPAFDASGLADYFKERGILINPADNGYFRLVTHNDVNRDDIDRLVAELKKFMG
ncbi:MAG: low-specificity L-threonine aldolase [Candidatus Adiutrix sp.]|jgi:threonine aldolase|nr:low-specificity L-threonine aldolase [Candidatus Adiutrix sp.]